MFEKMRETLRQMPMAPFSQRDDQARSVKAEDPSDTDRQRHRKTADGFAAEEERMTAAMIVTFASTIVECARERGHGLDERMGGSLSSWMRIIDQHVRSTAMPTIGTMPAIPGKVSVAPARLSTAKDEDQVEGERDNGDDAENAERNHKRCDRATDGPVDAKMGLAPKLG